MPQNNTNIVSSPSDKNEAMVNLWLDREQQGVKYPVDFDDAWEIAGYARKDSGKRKLVDQGYFTEGEDFHIVVERTLHKDSSSFSSKENIKLTLDAFKEFCMLSRTSKGKQVRKYFIEAEKRWKLVQQDHSAIAESVEERILKQQEKILEKQALVAEKQALVAERQERLIDKANTLALLHGEEFALVTMGHGDKVVKIEKPVTEVRDPVSNTTEKIMTAPQVKQYIQDKTGVKIKSLKQFTDELQKLGRDDLLIPVTRHSTTLYPVPDKIDDAIALAIKSRTGRQLLLGE